MRPSAFVEEVHRLEAEAVAEAAQAEEKHVRFASEAQYQTAPETPEEPETEVPVPEPVPTALKKFDCMFDHADAVNLFQWFDLPYEKGDDTICNMLTALLSMSHLNYTIVDMKAQGGYGFALNAVDVAGEPCIIKLLLLKEGKTEDGIVGNAQFDASVRVHRYLHREGLPVPALHEVLRVKLGNRDLGLEVMSMAPGWVVFDALQSYINDQSGVEVTALITNCAKVLREIHATARVHGDAHLKNFLVSGVKVTAIDFDFSSAMEEFTEYDIVKMLASISEVCDTCGRYCNFEVLKNTFLHAYYDSQEEIDEFVENHMTGFGWGDADDQKHELFKSMKSLHVAYGEALP